MSDVGRKSSVVLITEARRARESRAKAAGLVPIYTMEAALRWGGDWEAYAHRLERQIWRMEIALLLAEAQRDASDLLLKIAEEELERVRGQLG